MNLIKPIEEKALSPSFLRDQPPFLPKEISLCRLILIRGGRRTGVALQVEPPPTVDNMQGQIANASRGMQILKNDKK